MAGEARAQLMPDNKRLHLQHGPIDIIAETFGAPAEITRSYEQAAAYFANVLEDLAAVLPVLRGPVTLGPAPLLAGIAREMRSACVSYATDHFITSMAAVAGAVADSVLAAMIRDRTLDKAYVNNGGDIALYLAPGQSLRMAVVDNADKPSLDAGLVLTSADGIGGVATSGWRGRSLSPGIADAVTVLAKTAAMADVAATLIAGAVDVASPKITKAPASTLRDDTDLGDMLVTTAVGPLSDAEKHEALGRGWALGERFKRRGLISAAYLSLQGERAVLAALEIKTNWRRA
ncbi:MAG: UPF0280 family protein [Sneathiella sp.]|nr:UPF0280 family protein [Sneathiella sp.]